MEHRMTEAEKIDGVTLQTISINAASPDLIGTVMKQITEAVLKAIPPGAIEKIAEQLIQSGKVVRTETVGGWDRSVKTVEYVLADEARKILVQKLEKAIDRQVETYIANEEVHELVSKQVSDGVAAAIGNFHTYVASEASKRLAYRVMDDNFHAVNVQAANVPQIAEQVAKIRQALIQNGAIQSWQVQ